MRAMADDFRLVVEFPDDSHGLHFGRALSERRFERAVEDQVPESVLVTRDGPRVFLYTATEAQAKAAASAVQEVLSERGLQAEVSPIMRWHPVEERWEDASVPLPQSAAEVAVEHERQEEQEAEESRSLGYAEWEVRVDLPTHRDAVKLAERLEAEGISPLVRRWKYILIGTATDEDAQALAERIRIEAPEGATVKAEPSATIGWELTGQNPFAAFGGFGPAP
jgi:hypothetical protein